jgi:hypothetical protein
MKILNKKSFHIIAILGLLLGITPPAQAINWSTIRNTILAATAVRAVYDSFRDHRTDYSKPRVHWEGLLYMASFWIMVFDGKNIGKEWFPATPTQLPTSATKEIVGQLSSLKGEQKLMKILGRLQQ